MGDLRLDLGMLAAVPVKQAGQVGERDAARKADADLARLIEKVLAEPPESTVEHRRQDLRFPQQHRAGFGDGEAAGGPLEEFHPEPALDSLDLSGQRALRKPGGPGGGGDSPVLRHQAKQVEAMEIDQGG